MARLSWFVDGNGVDSEVIDSSLIHWEKGLDGVMTGTVEPEVLRCRSGFGNFLLSRFLVKVKDEPGVRRFCWTGIRTGEGTIYDDATGTVIIKALTGNTHFPAYGRTRYSH